MEFFFLRKEYELKKESKQALERGVLREDTIAQFEKIGLSQRVINSLEDSSFEIIYLEDLLCLELTELMCIDNIGRDSIEKICSIIVNYHKYEEKIVKNED